MKLSRTLPNRRAGECTPFITILATLGCTHFLRPRSLESPLASTLVIARSHLVGLSQIALISHTMQALRTTVRIFFHAFSSPSSNSVATLNIKRCNKDNTVCRLECGYFSCQIWKKTTTHIYEICLCGFDILSYTPSQRPPPEKQAGAISAAMGFDVAHIIPFRKKLVEIAFYCIEFSVSMRGWVTRLPTHLSSRTVCCQHKRSFTVYSSNTHQLGLSTPLTRASPRRHSHRYNA